MKGYFAMRTPRALALPVLSNVAKPNDDFSYQFETNADFSRLSEEASPEHYQEKIASNCRFRNPS